MSHHHHADAIAIKLVTVLVALSHKHPEATEDLHDVLLDMPELRGLMQPDHPISCAPSAASDRAAMLYCPEQGGWQTGVFSGGRWLDLSTLTKGLEPTHFADMPPEPA